MITDAILTLLRVVTALFLGGVGVILMILVVELGLQKPLNDRERRRNQDKYDVKEQLYFKERLWEEVERVEMDSNWARREKDSKWVR